jgi:hypothetical protein
VRSAGGTRMFERAELWELIFCKDSSLSAIETSLAVRARYAGVQLRAGNISEYSQKRGCEELCPNGTLWLLLYLVF